MEVSLFFSFIPNYRTLNIHLPSFLANEAVEKVPTSKKMSESGVPKWSLDPRSSLKR
jgi:hypothetical protein